MLFGNAVSTTNKILFTLIVFGRLKGCSKPSNFKPKQSARDVNKHKCIIQIWRLIRIFSFIHYNLTLISPLSILMHKLIVLNYAIWPIFYGPFYVNSIVIVLLSTH